MSVSYAGILLLFQYYGFSHILDGILYELGALLFTETQVLYKPLYTGLQEWIVWSCYMYCIWIWLN